MMIERQAKASWNGGTREGKGRVTVGSGAVEGPFTFASRFDGGEDTNPEELLGAAHASCFSMSLASALTKGGYAPTHVQTKATVELSELSTGFAIPRVRLDTQAEVEGISKHEFERVSAEVKISCPISKSLGGTLIDLKAELVEP